jgi:glycosyltransferase involved in cell wall biosynthesis
MPGPAIRAWHLAELLAAEHTVTLASSVACDRTHPTMQLVHADDEEIRQRAGDCAAIVAPGSFVRRYPWIESLDVPLAVDLYDPYHLENLEPDGQSLAEQAATVDHLSQVVVEDLRRGDFFLCASERQRDFWLGSLAAVGRVNPYTYAEDPALRHLIDLVPFGISPIPPMASAHGLRGVVPGIGEGDQILLWGGGVYNWFDPMSLLAAVRRLVPSFPRLRLVFLGMGHPNPEIPTMRVATELRSAADAWGLTDRQVFFLEGWVPYDRRADYLLDADIGVSTSPDHVETRFAFRTRVLDYLWTGLPTLLTAGDALAEVIGDAGAGVVVAPGDIDAMAVGIRQLLEGPPTAATIRAVADRYRWDRAAEPLVAWCRAPRVAGDRVARVPGPGGGKANAEGVTDVSSATPSASGWSLGQVLRTRRWSRPAG